MELSINERGFRLGVRVTLADDVLPGEDARALACRLATGLRTAALIGEEGRPPSRDGRCLLWKADGRMFAARLAEGEGYARIRPAHGRARCLDKDGTVTAEFDCDGVSRLKELASFYEERLGPGRGEAAEAFWLGHLHGRVTGAPPSHRELDALRGLFGPAAAEAEYRWLDLEDYLSTPGGDAPGRNDLGRPAGGMEAFHHAWAVERFTRRFSPLSTAEVAFWHGFLLARMREDAFRPTELQHLVALLPMEPRSPLADVLSGDPAGRRDAARRASRSVRSPFADAGPMDPVRRIALAVQAAARKGPEVEVDVRVWRHELAAPLHAWRGVDLALRGLQRMLERAEERSVRAPWTYPRAVAVLLPRGECRWTFC